MRLCCSAICVSVVVAETYSAALEATTPLINIDAPTSPAAEVLLINESKCIKYEPGSVKFTVLGAVKVIEVPVEFITVPKLASVPEATVCVPSLSTKILSIEAAGPVAPADPVHTTKSVKNY